MGSPEAEKKRVYFSAYFGKKDLDDGRAQGTRRLLLIVPIDVDDDGRVFLQQVLHRAANPGNIPAVSTELAGLVDAFAVPHEIGLAREMMSPLVGLGLQTCGASNARVACHPHALIRVRSEIPKLMGRSIGV